MNDGQLAFDFQQPVSPAGGKGKIYNKNMPVYFDNKDNTDNVKQKYKEIPVLSHQRTWFKGKPSLNSTWIYTAEGLYMSTSNLPSAPNVTFFEVIFSLGKNKGFISDHFQIKGCLDIKDGPALYRQWKNMMDLKEKTTCVQKTQKHNR